MINFRYTQPGLAIMFLNSGKKSENGEVIPSKSEEIRPNPCAFYKGLS